MIRLLCCLVQISVGRSAPTTGADGVVACGYLSKPCAKPAKPGSFTHFSQDDTTNRVPRFHSSLSHLVWTNCPCWLTEPQLFPLHDAILPNRQLLYHAMVILFSLSIPCA